jgi:DNA-binding transcriptional ArsR family regulator
MPEVDVFSALANPVRREILVRLRTGPRAVTELARGFAIGRPAVSEHLQVLRKANLVREEPRGRERYYHLDPRPLADAETWIAAFPNIGEIGWPLSRWCSTKRIGSD